MPAIDFVPTSDRLPERVDVVVIGGGVIGASTALSLAQKGFTIAMCEKGVVAGEQSSRNWGWCRAMGRDRREIPLIQHSLRFWRELEGTVGSDVGFRPCGIIYLCRTEAEMQAYGPWLESAKANEIDSRLITPGEVSKVLPGLSYPVAGALYTASDGRAEPAKATPAIAKTLRRLGGHVLTGCAARGVETKAGVVSGVATESGTIHCDAVVLAGGVWSRLFCGALGVKLPLLKVLGSVMRTHPIEGGPEVSAAGADFAFRRRADGGYTVSPGGVTTAEITPDNFALFADYLPVLRKEHRSLRPRLGRQFFAELVQPRRWPQDATSPFERSRVLDPQPDNRLLDRALESLRAAHPIFRQAREAERWGGYIDVTPDAVPVISPVEAIPGFFLAAGFSGHGFGLGPGAGRLMADLVVGDEPIVDPSPFRLSRFADRTQTVLDVGLSVSPDAGGGRGRASAAAN